MGRLPEVPGEFSQGAFVADLEENIRDSYRRMLDDQNPPPRVHVKVKGIEVPA